MKLSKKDKKLLLELVLCDMFDQEQTVGVNYEEKRVKRLRKLRVLLSAEDNNA